MCPFKKKPAGPPPTEWRSFDDAEPLLRWVHPSGTERVYLLRRPDGNYTDYSERFSNDEYEHAWVPAGSEGIYDSLPTARKEIAAQHPWLSEARAETRKPRKHRCIGAFPAE